MSFACFCFVQDREISKKLKLRINERRINLLKEKSRLAKDSICFDSNLKEINKILTHLFLSEFFFNIASFVHAN
jgi:hypothetical protein